MGRFSRSDFTMVSISSSLRLCFSRSSARDKNSIILSWFISEDLLSISLSLFNGLRVEKMWDTKRTNSLLFSSSLSFVDHIFNSRLPDQNTPAVAHNCKPSALYRPVYCPHAQAGHSRSFLDRNGYFLFCHCAPCLLLLYQTVPQASETVKMCSSRDIITPLAWCQHT